MEPVEDADPEFIGPYRILGVLGTGGMGRVYLGVDDAGNRAAVKVVNVELMRDPGFRKRFTREASATAAVSGRFIAGIVASGLEAPRPWLATEYIEGPSMSDVVGADGPLEPSRAQEIAAGLAEALGTIHAAEVVHRDVKPANILLAADGAYLIDFGIAREAAASTITRTGTVVGTPPYMAPEQIRGRRPVGPPADVFALGGVLVFALTGRHPFGEGDNTTLAYRIAHEEPDLDGVEDEVIRALILSCLAKDPDDRPTAAELRVRLASEATRVVRAGGGAGQGLPAQPLDPASLPGVSVTTDLSALTTDLSTPKRRRHLSAAALVALVLVILSAGILGADLSRGGSHGSSQGAQGAQGGQGAQGAQGGHLVDGSSSSAATSPTGSAPSLSTPATTAGTPLPPPGSTSGHAAPNPATTITTTCCGPTTGAVPTTAPPATTPPSRSTTTVPPHPTTTPPKSTASSPPPPGNPPHPVSGASSSLTNNADYSGFNMTITWAAQSDATSFDIHYTWESVGSPSIDTTYHATGTSYTIKNIPTYSQHYCWSIRAVNANGVSAWDAGSPHC